jgi:DNA-directed RNA polymerase subunit K/omega
MSNDYDTDVDTEAEVASDTESVVDDTDADADADAEDGDDVYEPPSTETEYSRNIIVIPDAERRTSNVISKFELTEVISVRTEQIARYANCLVDTAGLSDPRQQAIREFNERKTPLKIRRQLGERVINGRIYQCVELWSPGEMTCIHELD